MASGDRMFYEILDLLRLLGRADSCVGEKDGSCPVFGVPSAKVEFRKPIWMSVRPHVHVEVGIRVARITRRHSKTDRAPLFPRLAVDVDQARDIEVMGPDPDPTGTVGFRRNMAENEIRVVIPARQLGVFRCGLAESSPCSDGVVRNLELRPGQFRGPAMVSGELRGQPLFRIVEPPTRKGKRFLPGVRLDRDHPLGGGQGDMRATCSFQGFPNEGTCLEHTPPMGVVCSGGREGLPGCGNQLERPMDFVAGRADCVECDRTQWGPPAAGILRWAHRDLLVIGVGRPLAS